MGVVEDKLIVKLKEIETWRLIASLFWNCVLLLVQLFVFNLSLAPSFSFFIDHILLIWFLVGVSGACQILLTVSFYADMSIALADSDDVFEHGLLNPLHAGFVFISTLFVVVSIRLVDLLWCVPLVMCVNHHLVATTSTDICSFQSVVGFFFNLALVGLLYDPISYHGCSGRLLLSCPYEEVCFSWDYVFVVVVGTLAQAWSALLIVHFRKQYVRFPLIQKPRILRFQDDFVFCLLLAIRYAMRVVFVASAVYYVFFYSAAESSLVSVSMISLRGIVVGEGSFVVKLLLKLFLHCVLVFLNFQLLTTTCQILFTERITFSRQKFGLETDMPDTCLSFALQQNQSLLVQHLAFLDLHLVAKFDGEASRRQTLYADSSGERWREVLTCCCQMLDNVTISIQELKKNEQDASKNKKQTESSKQQNFIMAYYSKLKAAFFSSLFSPSQEIKPNPFQLLRMQMWAAESATNLTCRSLHEDQIGIVQASDSFSVLLNSLLACLLAVEQFIETPLGRLHFEAYANAVTRDSQLFNASAVVVRKEPAILADTLHTCIYTIVTTFYEHLSDLQFPPQHAAKLQWFVEFRQ